MKNNPQINNFLDIGIKRFADRGIDGIKIDEICEEAGVAKSSFYHYFDSKKGFVEKLFDYWYFLTTEGVYDQVKHIDDGMERFLALKDLIYANIEIEQCHLQIKLFALSNEKARAVVEKVQQKRLEILFELFKMTGLTDEEAARSSRKMMLMYYGRVALTHGYTGSIEDIDISTEEMISFLGLKNS